MTDSGNPPKICVLGACNVDLTCYAERMPKWGETLRGNSFDLTYGGKGANQAVIAAKLGARVSMVSKLGADLFGQSILDNLKGFGIDVTHSTTTDKGRTGAAQIMVDDKGRNAIVVVTGASDLMSEADVLASKTQIEEADLLLVQWEMPLAISMQAMRIAQEAGTKVIFNPAPIGLDISDEIFSLCDTVCVNETEIMALTRMPVDTVPQIEQASLELLGRGAKSVIVTLGKKGAFYASREDSFFVEGEAANTVDSTGAGDCFIGSFAYFIAQGSTPKTCVSYANKIAALSVQKKGTQISYPSREELPFLPQ